MIVIHMALLLLGLVGGMIVIHMALLVLGVVGGIKVPSSVVFVLPPGGNKDARRIINVY